MDTDCVLEFIPTFSVCVPIFGCTEWEAGQVEIDNIESTVTHSFPVNDLVFPLPALDSAQTIDFGYVAPDNTTNQELLIDNLGQMLLEGTATLDDPQGVFSLFGANIYIPVDGTDSLVFAFSGSEIGEYSATVQIDSNDPALPAKTIQLTASVTNDGDLIGGKTVSDGCGCASTDASQLPYPLLLLFPLVTVSRRREAQ